MATFDDVRRLTADLPMVEEGTSYGTQSMKVKGKSFCRMWGDREYDRDDVHDTEILVVFCDIEEKEAILDAHEAVFETSHYRGHGGFLIRLADVELEDLANHLEHSYRRKAPVTARRMLEAD